MEEPSYLAFVSIKQINVHCIVKKHVRKLDDHILPMDFVRIISFYDYYCGDESLFS